MKSLLVLCAFLLSAHAQAGQDWELISITHGAAWEVNQAKGPLQQNGNVLEGVLKDKTDGRADYRIRIELKGGRAEAAFRFVSENDRGTKLAGTYHKSAQSKSHCPEQIQLLNGFQYIGLARDPCEP